MNTKTILLLGLFLAVALLVCSEVTAATSEEGAKSRAVGDAKYQGGSGYGGYPGGGGRGGNGGGRGYKGGRRGGYCRYGCCGRSYNGCRCCAYAGEKMVDAEP